MNISAIDAQSASVLPLPVERNAPAPSNPVATGDTVNVRRPARLLDDEEAQAVLERTIGMIQDNKLEMRDYHNSLDPTRVAALLA